MFGMIWARTDEGLKESRARCMCIDYGLLLCNCRSGDGACKPSEKRHSTCRIWHRAIFEK